MAECKDCGRDLHVQAVEKPNIDWVKVVCSGCNNVEEISMVRLSEAATRE